ncbi:MAG: glycosyltransferase family 4 protein [Solirubrobacteraceae bacterium]
MTPRVVVDMHIVDRPTMEWTGVGRYALESTAALCAARPDWHFIVLTNRPDLVSADNAVVIPTGWPTHHAAARVAWLHLGSAWQLRNLRADLWLGTAFTLPWWWRGSSLVTIHDLMFLELPSSYSSRVNGAYASGATRWAARHADRIVCPSNETVGRLAQRFGIDASKTEVVFYGVSDSLLCERTIQSAGQGDYLLFVGTFEPRKGLPELYRALELINSSRDRPLELKLAGKPGWGIDDTMSKLERDPCVELLINPTDRELAVLYRDSLALVYPSRAEGFGLPVAEAMACGTPVIASNLSCIRDFARDAPLYVPPGDAHAIAARVLELLDDPALASSCAKRGKANAEQLRWSAVGERLAAIVETILAGTEGRPSRAEADGGVT